jgi:hypothetical protein
LRTWGIIVAILVLSGILTVAWPALMDRLSGGSAAEIPATMESVTLNLPVAVAGMNSITLNSLQILLFFALLVGGLVVGTGIALALVNVIISRLVTNTGNSESFQARQARLNERTAERIKRLRDERKTARTSPERWRRWSVISTGAIFVVFAIFAGYLLAYTFYPEGVIVTADRIVAVTSLIIGTMVLLTILFLVFRLRVRQLEALETAAVGAIPWDFIVVVLTGLLVVGLGIGIIILINSGG